jgi:hypothetical protein
LTPKKITVKLTFGAVQTLLAFLAIVLALFLEFNALNLQSSTGVPDDAVNFYVMILLALGFVSVVSGLFQVYDWWESI